MDSSKNQLVEKLHQATNILVTVSRNPSVDQLSACIGLTLALNKYGKHATAVYSGTTPSTIEFLEPENTLEKNTDSLRDFIIALDKAKADKLRYKVEDEMVRIFITPYRTSLSSDDLVFSQGDFNVDAVVALGVTQQQDFDDAITAHGRILHDATVISINVNGGAEIGSIHLSDPNASSLSELVAQITNDLDQKLLDNQIATALLTGIVAETARFSNAKTSPQTMSVSAQLMAAGANQQLVASRLEEPEREDPPADAIVAESQDDATAPADESADTPTAEEAPKPEPGTLEIKHTADEEPADDAAPMTGIEELLAEHAVEPEPEVSEAQVPPAEQEPSAKPSRLIVEPPTLGGKLTANTEPEGLDPANDPLGVKPNTDAQLLSRPEPKEMPQPSVDLPQPVDPTPHSASGPVLPGFTPPPPAWVPPSASPQTDESHEKTLSEIETSVNSIHLGSANVEDARSEVEKALNSLPPQPEPVQALGAQPMVDSLNTQPQASPAFTDVLAQAIPAAPPASQEPPQMQQPQVVDPTAPPPVPPPIPFNFGSQQPPQQ